MYVLTNRDLKGRNMVASVTSEWESERRLTAIARRGLSVPARTALAERQIAANTTVLDYGCGRGGDVEALRKLGVPAQGWDPVFSPRIKPQLSHTVLLTYVLNVIEDPKERVQTLRRAWELTEHVLVVSTRLTWERRRVTGQEFSDGVLTSRRTFQHLFDANELRRYVQDTTKVRCVSAAPGVIYAFKHDNDRLAYLAQRIIPEEQWGEANNATSAVAAMVSFTEHRGRSPRLDEMPESVLDSLRHLRSRELQRLVRTAVDTEKVQENAKRSTLNTLLFLALEVFNGRGRFSSLPLAVQFDIRAFFTSYTEACRRADRLLLKLRDNAYVRAAMRGSKAGKLTLTALYVHRRAVEQIPTVLRLYEHCAAIAAGRPPAWNLVKLQHEGRGVGWFDYPDFDADPHPRLANSYTVDLPTFITSFRSYEESEDRPLLHKKHEFLPPEDPDASKYRRLSQAENRAGLYQNPALIRTEQGWESELDRCGRRLQGHRLVRRNRPGNEE
ncbi:DNA phosphorothioation-associated putative methyltransferase [Nocardiopsis dassonvillei]|uniref:DNA phosphorothioation-associated putative methyltransferase n=1 Tax=Nocardiopsis dassonvillei TaxID=2014 RepID=UPI003702B418